VSRRVLDTSALLALLNGEPGQDLVFEALADGAIVSAVNLAEVVTKLSERGLPEARIRAALSGLRFDVTDLDTEQAHLTGLLRPLTRHLGLSLGDQACLALARTLGLPALTAERAWGTLALGVVVEVIR
jgi:ribonuclease VapC